MSILLTESQYFPPICYYLNLIKYPDVKIEQYEHYQKLSYRNRCYVAGPNGSILLSVPLLKGKNQRTLMKDVRIANEEKWQALHWKTLTSAYRRSPWFEFFEDELNPYFEKRYNFLLDWNMELFALINNWLGISPNIDLTSEYIMYYENNLIKDFRNVIRPGKSANEVCNQLPEYQQVFGERTGFLENMSIIDLIFCEGRNALSYLKNDNK